MTQFSIAALCARKPDIEDEFWARVGLPWNSPLGDACWEWRGSRGAGGYGVLSTGDRKRVLAHRVSYAIVHGPFDAGLDVLHHCDNPPCVRFSHLYAGTARENMLDAYRRGRRVPLHGHRVRSHCRNGHPLVPENVWVEANGYQRCRECGRSDNAARYRRRVNG